MATRLRALSEAEAYARCYAGSEDVRVVKIPRRPRYQLDVTGEDLRVAFAERLDKREPELEEGAGETAAPAGPEAAEGDDTGPAAAAA